MSMPISQTAKRFSVALLVFMVVAATAARFAPLVEGGERLKWQCVSEDGYLMLTIARNMALGRGFSVSDGLIPSNGTQPLAALLYAFCLWCVDADKYRGLYGIVGAQALLSALTALLLFVAVRKYLFRGGHPEFVAMIAACIWYASPTAVMHSQNSLETGLYVLLILGSVMCYDAITPTLRRRLSPMLCLLLGALLGITFLGRNDACFLIATMLLIHLALAYQYRQLWRAFAQALIMGATSVLVAVPWLWFNLTKFGHIVPVSGRAEALHVHFAHNLLPAFVAVLENSLLVVRIPGFLEKNTVVIVGSCGFLTLALALLYLKRAWLTERFTPGVGILACFTGTLFVYYALFFGMPSFLGRYLFIVTMLVAVLGAAIVAALVERASRASQKSLLGAVALAAALVCVLSDARVYSKGREHLHKQVVEWVAANVPDDTWVGAIQTGTLGYYHDRTVNLDGKVDPFALAARAAGKIHEYVIERNVEYLADWAGISTWSERPEFAANYELIVYEPEHNLAVLRRSANELSN